MIMWNVIYETNEVSLPSLDEAMKYAKTLNKFVTIKSGDTEFVGKFGVDAVIDKKLPDGESYTWTMRRDETHRSSRKKLV
jgi:hypothetical protein